MDIVCSPPQPSPNHRRPNPFSLPFSFALNKKETAFAIATFVFVLSLLLLSLEAATPFRPLSLLRLFSTTPSGHVNRTVDAAGTCDYSYGRWVQDDGYSDRLYSENCPFMDPGFQCRKNGRNDSGYLNWRWQPHGCDLPRFNASDMLERSRNGRIVFVGDSIGRNHWESLVCILAEYVKNQSSIYEMYGNPITKHKGFLAIRFDEYNLTVEYYRAPYLVVIGHPPPNSPPEVRKAIRVDTMQWVSKRWVGADVFIFNAGHWWNKDKTLKAGNYFQEGNALNKSIDVKEAFHKILEAWRLWVFKNVQLDRSFVFFRSYAPSHYSHGSWDGGGFCDRWTGPYINITALRNPPWNNAFISRTVETMKGDGRNVECLNITYLTELRRDGHPSNHIEPGFPPNSPQDCSHWCLPGVPDTWNELLYAHLLSRGYDTRRRS